MVQFKKITFFNKLVINIPILLLLVSVLNEFDFNYLNIDYFSFNFPFILIFYFTLKEYSRFDFLLVFIAGLINDTVIGLPLGISSFFVGNGIARTFFFAGLEAEILVMTMPDLQTFHIKRSPYPVKYVYLHHSLVSTHMIYRSEAFDSFDSILCVGPHHLAEIKARETLYNLPCKELVQHGYGKLDKAIDLLNKNPGIYSARWGGKNSNFNKAIRRVYRELNKKDKNWKSKKIKARFICALSISYLNKKIACVLGKVEGQISKQSRGKNGFGYDPIFIPLKKRKTFGEMEPSQKYKMDHRYQAFKKIRKFL